MEHVTWIIMPEVAGELGMERRWIPAAEYIAFSALRMALD